MVNNPGSVGTRLHADSLSLTQQPQYDDDDQYDLQWGSGTSAEVTPSSMALALAMDSNEPLALNHSDKSSPQVYRLMILSLVLSLLICIFNFLGTFSCTNDSFTQCYPQLTLRFRDTPQARLYLGSAREGLRMASFFAKDFSVTLNDGHKLSERIRHINTIDSLSDKNLFKFNYNGFCRKSMLTGVESCTYSHGLDLFSSLTKDIGLQLGVVSKAENPTEIGDSLATAYGLSLDTLGQYFGSGKKKVEHHVDPQTNSGAKEKQKEKEEESNFIDKAKQMKYFGKSISTITSVLMEMSYYT
ncbi:uncharacterized protein CANTADRAFT_22833 [Suhomyces tanzawaensis NRRL Y-17324]|uniref:Uncharacterized protein n=1 Tax=Suhomyces tanzawaensis NRRL Y-17324 TaxID=984487 RepID=A0A1E4SDX5_9ASCO|nr:uncharacterized protein CANTADRAFT_22833 [Suhomyces tanzawaensis NRRL Y-17324]ODV77705.1 hypothetical protein CANTADRAFT_22833 [Suhomyces tanzawaensis NRRL Y-17324]